MSQRKTKTTAPAQQIAKRGRVSFLTMETRFRQEEIPDEHGFPAAVRIHMPMGKFKTTGRQRFAAVNINGVWFQAIDEGSPLAESYAADWDSMA